MSVDEHPLVACMQILQGFGEAGEAIWELGDLYINRKKDPLSQKERFLYLKKAIVHLREKAKEKGVWRTLPVDFRTFVESPRYMDKAAILWPRVMEHAEEINSGKYTECVLTGAIGVAKTTIALYTQAYQLYIKSCMESPHEVFDLDPASEIMTVFQSLNRNAAMDVDYRRFREMISTSPYFVNQFPFQKDRESDMRFPRNIVVKPVAGHDTAAIGQNVDGGILDELNFMAITEKSKLSGDGGEYDQAMQNYNSIARRRESRFMVKGRLPGMLCLVSSRKYPGQFTDVKEEEAKTNPHIYVYAKRIWELRPDRFCGETFDVFIGDIARKPRIMQEGNAVKEDDAHLVMAIPIEFRQKFESNMLDSLRDIAGVSTQALHPYIGDTDKIAACFGKTPGLLSRTDCDFLTMRPLFYPKRIVHPKEPRFVHLDMSFGRQDSFGLAVGHVPEFINCNRGDITERLPIIYMDILLELRAPPNGEIDFARVRQFLYGLRAQGLPLKWLSCDSFQSKDMMQRCAQNGLVVGYTSVDTSLDPYDITKQAIYDGRLWCQAHEKAQTELVRLEYDAKDDKVDHPKSGSKDVADAIAGVTYGLTMRRETWIRHGVPQRNAPKTLTTKIQRPAPASYSDMLVQQRGDKRLAGRRSEEAKYGPSKFLVRDGEKRL